MAAAPVPDALRLARFALELGRREVPAPVRDAARSAILDALACAVAGRDEPVTGRARAWALAQGGSPRATLWGTAARTSAALAALVNGTALHALDYDDVNWAMRGHPSAPLLPAVLAAAEEVGGASGEDVLLAYVAGFEAEACVGSALSSAHYERGWHPTSTAGIFGAVAASGRLLGLGADALARAFGLACSRASGTRLAFGTDAKPLHAGFAARAGLECAQLALLGVSARGDALEGPMGLADLYGERPWKLREPGAPFALESPGLELKPYPSCRFTHRTIDAVCALRERHRGAEAEALFCEVEPLALEILIHPTPRTGLEAKFSLPYCAAVAWLDGAPTLASFADERVQRADVQSLLRRVQVGIAPDAAASVRLQLRSGILDGERVRYARGSPRRPLGPQARRRKAMDCLEPALGPERADALCEAIEGLDRAPSLERVRALLGGAAPA